MLYTLSILLQNMAKAQLSGYKCDRCEHKWVPRKKIKPTVCPRCKSAYWNRERQRKVKKSK